jgi:hypothetical protein
MTASCGPQQHHTADARVPFTPLRANVSAAAPVTGAGGGVYASGTRAAAAAAELAAHAHAHPLSSSHGPVCAPAATKAFPVTSAATAAASVVFIGTTANKENDAAGHAAGSFGHARKPVHGHPCPGYAYAYGGSSSNSNSARERSSSFGNDDSYPQSQQAAQTLQSHSHEQLTQTTQMCDNDDEADQHLHLQHEQQSLAAPAFGPAAPSVAPVAAAVASAPGRRLVSKQFRDGSCYTGEVCTETRRRCGRGVYRNPAGDEYDGEWREDRRDGQGVYRWPNGDRYTGGWAADRMHGRGVFAWACGEEYDGDWQRGKMCGHGRRVLANGDVYEGQWEADQSNGHGRKVRKQRKLRRLIVLTCSCVFPHSLVLCLSFS